MLLASSGAGGTAAVDNGSLAGFHGRAAVAFIRADRSCTRLNGCGVDSECTGLTFKFAKNGVLVGKQVADQSVAVTLVHCQAAFKAGTENARGEDLCQ